MAEMGVVSKDGAKIYQYMNFDKIADFSDLADKVAA